MALTEIWESLKIGLNRFAGSHACGILLLSNTRKLVPATRFRRRARSPPFIWRHHTARL